MKEIYKNVNQYNYTTKTIEIDNEKKEVVVYGGMTGPITTNKITKKRMKEMIDFYLKNGYKIIEK